MYSRSQKKSDKRHLFTTLWLIRYSNDASAMLQAMNLGKYLICLSVF